MPTPDTILEGLGRIANELQWLAVLWHIFSGTLALALLAGARPSRRLAGILLALPLLSVAVLAWVAGNPFNGVVFGLTGGALVVLAARAPRGPVAVGAPWSVAVGVLLFAFGWLYPHFLETTSYWTYAYAAPTGLVPCPTLSIVIGAAITVRGLESRAWSIVLAVAGLFYGLFGALRLGVSLDWALTVGAAILLAGTLRGWRLREPPGPTRAPAATTP